MADLSRDRVTTFDLSLSVTDRAGQPARSDHSDTLPLGGVTVVTGLASSAVGALPGRQAQRELSIVPGSIRHIRPMSRRLRPAACITLQGYGMDPRVGLHRAFMASFYCRTAIVDGRPGAMWGAQGALLGNEAIVWLVLSEDIAAIPHAITRQAKAELAQIMRHHDEVAITVLPDDLAAVRFAVMLGFHDRPNDDGRLSRKELTAAILADPKHKIPVGDSYVIALGYHPTERH